MSHVGPPCSELHLQLATPCAVLPALARSPTHCAGRLPEQKVRLKRSSMVVSAACCSSAYLPEGGGQAGQGRALEVSVGRARRGTCRPPHTAHRRLSAPARIVRVRCGIRLEGPGAAQPGRPGPGACLNGRLPHTLLNTCQGTPLPVSSGHLSWESGTKRGGRQQADGEKASQKVGMQGRRAAWHYNAHRCPHTHSTRQPALHLHGGGRSTGGVAVCSTQRGWGAGRDVALLPRTPPAPAVKTTPAVSCELSLLHACVAHTAARVLGDARRRMQNAAACGRSTPARLRLTAHP